MAPACGDEERDGDCSVLQGLLRRCMQQVPACRASSAVSSLLAEGRCGDGISESQLGGSAVCDMSQCFKYTRCCCHWETLQVPISCSVDPCESQLVHLMLCRN